MLQFPRPEVVSQLSPGTPSLGLNQSQVCNTPSPPLLNNLYKNPLSGPVPRVSCSAAAAAASDGWRRALKLTHIKYSLKTLVFALNLVSLWSFGGPDFGHNSI